MAMTAFITENASWIRLSCFLAVFMLMALWEVWRPCRDLVADKTVRWLNNLGLLVLNTVLLRLLFPSAAAGMAHFAAEHGYGVLNYLAVPAWLALLVTLVALDFVVWAQHVFFHAVPNLWRFHRVHHADPDFDVTTGTRFHPVEIVLSMAIKLAAILLLGAAVEAVLIFEVLLNACAMFNHGNVQLPTAADRVLRLLVVTPDMHRVHHSIETDELNANFGFNLSCWDRWFGTYRAQPRGGHHDMRIGIRALNAPREVCWLWGLLMLPFKSLKDANQP